MNFSKTTYIFLFFSIILFWSSFAVDFWSVNLGSLENSGIIKASDVGWDFSSSLVNIIADILQKIKVVLNWVAILALLYVATLLIVNFGEESRVTEWRKKLLYTLVALVLINVPERIYQVMTGNSSVTSQKLAKVSRGQGLSGRDGGGTFSDAELAQCNILFCPDGLGESSILIKSLRFLEVILIATAVIMFTYGAIRLIMAGSDEEQKKTQKNRFIYGLLALLLAGFIQTIYEVVFIGGTVWVDAIPPLMQIANVFLFFAGPVAIIFLIIGWYLLITSAGNEERVNRAKRILINTFLAVILLLLSYVFMLEISTINI